MLFFKGRLQCDISVKKWKGFRHFEVLGDNAII